MALISADESGATAYVTWGELRCRVGALAGRLRRRGVTAGHRVVGCLPNSAHTVVAFLACASIGAVWSACGQDYGAEGAAGRSAQLDLGPGDRFLWCLRGGGRAARHPGKPRRRRRTARRRLLDAPVRGPGARLGAGVFHPVRTGGQGRGA
ncbi:AMP-binding protein [Streptomyces sp. SID2563]|uniref:AMP-binding protein n=1 Tax=Streptomyces sp. SID2563 TaxID=2690255 RepID=UPI0031FECFAD